MFCPKCANSMVKVPAPFGKPEYDYCRTCKKDLEELRSLLTPIASPSGNTTASRSRSTSYNCFDEMLKGRPPGRHTWSRVSTPASGDLCDCRSTSAPGTPATVRFCINCAGAGTCLRCIQAVAQVIALMPNGMYLAVETSSGSACYASTKNDTHCFASSKPGNPETCRCGRFTWNDIQQASNTGNVRGVSYPTYCARCYGSGCTSCGQGFVNPAHQSQIPCTSCLGAGCTYCGYSGVGKI